MTRKQILIKNAKAIESVPEKERLFFAQMLLNMIYKELEKEG